MKKIFLFLFAVVHFLGVAQIDPNYPQIDDYVNSGVIGGIPTTRNNFANVDPTFDLQPVIDNAAIAYQNTGIVQQINLDAGDYHILSEGLQLKGGTVLHGVEKNRLAVKIYSDEVFADGGQFNGELRIITINQNTSLNGLEWLTVEYRGSCELNTPKDYFTEFGFVNLYTNGRCGGTTDVNGVRFNSGSSNNWINNCVIYEIGDKPIQIEDTSHNNTITNTRVDGSYKSGEGGAGYFQILGYNNLIAYNDVMRIRHFAIERGADHNVVVFNDFNTDINFHDDDDGFNISEQNHLKPHPDSFGPIRTGTNTVASHSPPHPEGNFFWRNSTYRNVDEEAIEFVDVATEIYHLVDFMGPGDLLPDFGFGFDTIVAPLPVNNTFYPLEISTAPERTHKRILIYYNGSGTSLAKKKVIAAKSEELGLSTGIEPTHDVLGFDIESKMGDLDVYFSTIIIVNQQPIAFNTEQQNSLNNFSGDVVYLNDNAFDSDIEAALDVIWEEATSENIVNNPFELLKEKRRAATKSIIKAINN